MNYNKIIYALLMQTLLIGSICLIYFRSTVIEGLEAVPQELQRNQVPANRLVVFLLDGLRSRDFFQEGCNNVPHLRQIFLHQGLVGIIRRKPTPADMRAAHVAIFAGFNEEYAAASFDTLFNRSTRSYAWSSHMLESFPRLHLTRKDASLVEAGKQTYKLNEAVFQSLNQSLSKGSKFLDKDGAIIYLVHLGGLQLAEGMKFFRENLLYTEHEICKTYQRFENVFPDQRTAYLLVSTDKMESPVFLWGSGVAHSKSLTGRSILAQDQRRPLHIFDYIELTPLMSALLGIPTPVNNRGILPTGLLNASSHYEACAMQMNSLQLLAQAKHLVTLHRRGLLSGILPEFWLTNKMMDSFLSTCHLLGLQKRFRTLREYSANFMPSLVKCIDYYQVYYQGLMMMATTLGLLGWLYYLRCQLGTTSSSFYGQTSRTCFLIFNGFVLMISFFVLAFVVLQRVPWKVIYVLLLPTFIWSLALTAHRSDMVLPTTFKELFCPSVLGLCCFIGFKYRHFLGIIYLGFASYNNRRALRLGLRDTELFLWLLLVCGLAGITWLPPSLGYIQRNLLLASIPLTFLRPLAFGIIHQRKILICNGLILTMAFIYILYRPTAWVMNFISWAYLCYIFQRRSQSDIELIFNLSTIYTLLCTSYETLVIQLLATELNLGLRLRYRNQVQVNERTIAIYILIYSCYSFLVLGNVAEVEIFQQSLSYTCFGNYSFTLPLIIGLKFSLPLFLLLCVMGRTYKEVLHVGNGQKVFYWLLFISNTMALLFLIRIRNFTSWLEVASNVKLILIVQVWPFLVEMLRSLAYFLLGIRCSIKLPKCEPTLINIL